MINRNSFVFYKDWMEALQEYPSDIRLEVYEGIILYATSGKVHSLRPIAKMAFNFVKTTIDRDIEKYQSVVERNRNNGKKGGRKSKEEIQLIPENPVGSLETQQNPNNLDRDSENGSDNDNEFKTTGNKLPSSEGIPHAEKIDFDKLIVFFNLETRTAFGEVRLPLSDKRRKMVSARIKEHGKESFVDVIKKAAASDFLRGQNQRGFTATFDWLIKPTNFEKTLSGNYDNRQPLQTNRENNSANSQAIKQSIVDEFARISAREAAGGKG